MPAVSRQQFKFMKMLEKNPDIAKEHGITPEKAAEFTAENTGEKAYNKLPEKKRFRKLLK